MWNSIAKLTGDNRWIKWHKEIIFHFIQGALAGVGIMSNVPAFMLAGTVWIAVSVAYQFAGYVKKADTVCLDIKDYMVGLGAAIAICTVIKLKNS